MDFLERDLEDIIFNADKEKLKDRGLDIPGVVKRQLKIGNYGIADLVSFSKEYIYIDYEGKEMPVLVINIYELKKDNIDINTFFQALRYCKGISRYIYNHRDSCVHIVFNINLICKNIETRNSLMYLPDMIDSNYPHCIANVNLYTYLYGLDGLTFQKHQQYYLKNEGF